MSSAATDWANKRRAQILRAEQLRAQRKAGIVDDGGSHTTKSSSRGGGGGAGFASADSLDNLAGAQGHKTGNAAIDDIFEVPLGGGGGGKKPKQPIFLDTDTHHVVAPEPQLSPGSDTLGREMKRYTHQDYDHDGGDGGGGYLDQHTQSGRDREQQRGGESGGGGEGGYKSKFMKQYESPAAPQGRKTHRDNRGSGGGNGGRREPEHFFAEDDHRTNGYQSPSKSFVFNGEDLGGAPAAPERDQYSSSSSSYQRTERESARQVPVSSRRKVAAAANVSSSSSSHYDDDQYDRQQQQQQPSSRGKSSGTPPAPEGGSSARARNKASSQARTDAQKEQENEAEDEFLRSLRSDAPQGGGGKPGWNDDFSAGATNTTGLFGDPKPVPKRNRSTVKATAKVDTGSVRGGGSKERSSGGGGGGGGGGRNATIVNVGDDMPLPTQTRKDSSGHAGFGSEYPDDYNPSKYDRGGDRDRDRDRDRDNRGPMPGRSSSPDNAGEQKAHARSRLSLLKNKIRLSESSTGSRASLKGSMERSRSDVQEHVHSNARTGRTDSYDEPRGGSGKYNYDYSNDDYGATETVEDDNHDYDVGYSSRYQQGGSKARASGGGSSTRDRDRSRGGRGGGDDGNTAFRSKYSDSVFDAADHPGNADLYPTAAARGSRDREGSEGGYYKEKGVFRGGRDYHDDDDYDDYRGGGGRNANDGGEYHLDALDHYHSGSGRGDSNNHNKRQQQEQQQQKKKQQPASTMQSSPSNPHGASGYADIYSAAADLPGAYPDGEAPPPQARGGGGGGGGGDSSRAHGASRFDDDDDYDAEPAREHVFSNSKLAARQRAREQEREQRERESSRGDRNDHYHDSRDRDSYHSNHGTSEREHARAKPSRAGAVAQRQREEREAAASSRPSRSSKYDDDSRPGWNDDFTTGADEDDGHGAYAARQQQSHNSRSGGGGRGGAASREAPPRKRAPSSSNSGGGGYDLSAIEGEEYAPPQPQRQCPDCGRSFNEDAFQRHAKVCAKVFMSKRKTFDSKKARIMGLADQNGQDAVQIAKEAARRERQSGNRGGGGGGRGGGSRGGGGKGGKWEEESRAFRDAMKAARQFSKAEKSGAPLPAHVPSGPDPNLTPCPHCGRRFNAKAADRHIPQCQNIKAKPSRLLKNSGMGAVATATKRGGGTTSGRGVTF